MSANLAGLAPKELAVKEADPHDIFVIEPDVVRATRADHMSANPAGDAASPARASQAPTVSDILAGVSAPSVDTTFRVTASDAVNVPGNRPARAGAARRAVIGFLLVFASLVAVALWNRYGETARAMAANWVPQFALASSPPAPTSAETGQPASPVLQASATDPAPAQPAPAPTQPAPAVATPSPESAQLQAMSQQIDELKASIAELKAGQTQLSHDMAKTSENRTSESRAAETRTAPARMAEPNPRPKMAALPPPRPAAPPVRKPRPAYAPMQAGVTPALPPPAPAPAMLQPPVPPPPPPEEAAQSEFGPVIRPPMPLR